MTEASDPWPQHLEILSSNLRVIAGMHREGDDSSLGMAAAVAYEMAADQIDRLVHIGENTVVLEPVKRRHLRLVADK